MDLLFNIRTTFDTIVKEEKGTVYTRYLVTKSQTYKTLTVTTLNKTSVINQVEL